MDLYAKDTTSTFTNSTMPILGKWARESSNIFIDETIRFTTFEEAGIVELTREPSSLAYNSTHYVAGLIVDLMESLQLILNFSLTRISFVDSFFSTDQFHLSWSGGGKWNETASHLIEMNETDIVLGYLYLVPSRVQVSHALLPLSTEKFYVYFRQPEVKQAGYENPFTEQLSARLSVALVAFLLMSAIILACMMSISQRQQDRRLSAPFFSHLAESFLWAIGTWCQQGPQLNISKWQAQLVMNLVNDICLLVYAMFCALVISTLSRPPALAVQTVEELFHFQYTFYAYPQTKSRLLIGSETKLFWNPPPPPSSFKGEEDEYDKMLSIQRVFTHRHAHLDTPDLFYPALSKQAILNKKRMGFYCGMLSVLAYKAGSIQGSLYARKGFKFRHEFNFALARIREVGVSKRQLDVYERLRDVSCGVVEKTKLYTDDLGLSQLSGLFMSLAASHLITLLILLSELIFLTKRKGYK